MNKKTVQFIVASTVLHFFGRAILDANKILEKIDTYITQHGKQGGRGSIHQDPYKSDFFKLCLEAYQQGYFEISSNPRLTGDAMNDYFWERWTSLDKEHRENKFKLLNKVITMWDEWHYTLDKIQYNV